MVSTTGSISSTGPVSRTGPLNSSTSQSPDDIRDSSSTSDSANRISLTLASDAAGSSDHDLSSPSPLALHQGDTIRLPDDGSIRLPKTSQQEGSLYQVIALDAGHDRCWIRSWPLTRHGSPVFEISLQQAQRHGSHRPVMQRPSP